MSTRCCACLRQVEPEPDPEPRPAASARPLVPLAEVLEDYRNGDSHRRMNLYLQHRELRSLFIELDD